MNLFLVSIWDGFYIVSTKVVLTDINLTQFKNDENFLLNYFCIELNKEYNESIESIKKVDLIAGSDTPEGCDRAQYVACLIYNNQK